MNNPADDAAVEDAKFNAKMARADAGTTMSTLAQQQSQFKSSAEQTLAGGMVSLAMSGNTSFKDNASPVASDTVGSTESESVTALRSSLADKQAQIDSNKDTSLPWKTASLQKEADDIQKQLDVVGQSSDTTISDPSMLLKASGSDLLTMMNTKESMQRDLNTFTRNQKDSALTMLKNAGHYDQSAEYAEQTKDYNTLNNILGWGFKAVGAVF